MDHETPSYRLRRIGKPLGRLLSFILIALLVGAVLSRLAAGESDDIRPAGFFRGMLQGALMPMAFPNLLLGRDVPIYSQNNVGLQYKLGYTAGVNVCGAVFFGVLFLRIQRFRSRFLKASSPSDATNADCGTNTIKR